MDKPTLADELHAADMADMADRGTLRRLRAALEEIHALRLSTEEEYEDANHEDAGRFLVAKQIAAEALGFCSHCFGSRVKPYGGFDADYKAIACPACDGTGSATPYVEA